MGRSRGRNFQQNLILAGQKIICPVAWLVEPRQVRGVPRVWNGVAYFIDMERPKGSDEPFAWGQKKATIGRMNMISLTIRKCSCGLFPGLLVRFMRI